MVSTSRSARTAVGMKMRELKNDKFDVPWQWHKVILNEWGAFTSGIAKAAQVDISSDVGRGDGLRLLALMLVQKDIPWNSDNGKCVIGDFKTYSACNHPELTAVAAQILGVSSTTISPDALQPPSTNVAHYKAFEFRQVIPAVVRTLLIQSDTAKLKCDLLTMSRVMVYLDDPYNSIKEQIGYKLDTTRAEVSDEERSQRYMRCLKGLALKKSEPERPLLRWVQNKYSELGLPEAALFCIGDLDPSVRLAAMLLSISLMDGGNTRVQNRFGYTLKTNPVVCDSFFAAMSESCDTVAESSSMFMSQIQKSFDNAGQSTILGQPSEEAIEAAMKETEAFAGVFDQDVKENATAIRMLQLLSEGHNKEMQDWCRHQGTNRGSVNMVKASISLFKALTLDIELVTICGEMRIFSVLIQLANLFTELMQGPNVVNQELLVNSDLIAAIMRCITAANFGLFRNANMVLSEDCDALMPVVLGLAGPLEEEEEKQLTMVMKAEFKVTLLVVLTAMLEGQQYSSLPAKVAQQIDSKLLLLELNELVAERGVMELDCINSRPKGCIPFGIVPYLEVLMKKHVDPRSTQSLPDKLTLEECREMVNLFEELSITIFDVLTTLQLSGVSSEVIRTWNMDDYKWLNLYDHDHTTYCDKIRVEMNDPEHCVCLEQLGKNFGNGSESIAASVEINYVGQIFTVWFPIPEHCIEMKEEDDIYRERVETMFRNIPRRNPSDKMNVLLDALLKLSAETGFMHRYRSSSNFLIKTVTSSAFRKLDIWRFMVSLIIVLLSIESYGHWDQPFEEGAGDWKEITVRALCVVHPVFLSLSSMSFIMKIITHEETARCHSHDGS